MNEVMGDGDDQAAAEGVEVEPVSEDDLEEAPEQDPDAPDDPNQGGDAA
jgi:hypothetical protein